MLYLYFFWALVRVALKSFQDTFFQYAADGLNEKLMMGSRARRPRVCGALDRVWRYKSTEVEGKKVRSRSSAKEERLAEKRSGAPLHKDWLATRATPGLSLAC